MKQTENLEFKDDHGRTRLSIGLDEDGSPEIVFFDENAKDRLQLKLTKGGKGALILKDQEGETYGGLSERGFVLSDQFKVIPALGGATMRLGDVPLTGLGNQFMIGNSDHQVSMFAHADTFQLLDAQERDRVRFIVDGDDAFLVLRDRDTDRGVAVGINGEDKEPKVQIFDSRGHGKISMQTKDEEPVVAFFSSASKGKPDMALGAFEGRDAGIAFFDEKGAEDGTIRRDRLRLGPVRGKPSFFVVVDKKGVVSTMVHPKADTCLVSAVFSDGSKILGLMDGKQQDMKHGVGVSAKGEVDIIGLEQKPAAKKRRGRRS